MSKLKIKAWLSGYMVIVMLVLAAGCNRPEQSSVVENSSPDMICLDAMRIFSPLERPAVLFPHQIHARALMDKGGCEVCHERSGKTLSFAFVTMDNLSPRSAMNAWHKQCVGCHEKSLDEKQTVGPLICGECHVKGRPAVPDIETLVFYDTYHEFHEELDGGCGLCHHEYDAEKDELYYEEGAESACWDCHEKDAGRGMPSIREASHLSCVNCHLETAAQADMALPVDCAGCHASAGVQAR